MTNKQNGLENGKLLSGWVNSMLKKKKPNLGFVKKTKPPKNPFPFIAQPNEFFLLFLIFLKFFFEKTKFAFFWFFKKDPGTSTLLMGQTSSFIGRLVAWGRMPTALQLGGGAGLGRVHNTHKGTKTAPQKMQVQKKNCTKHQQKNTCNQNYFRINKMLPKRFSLPE